MLAYVFHTSGITGMQAMHHCNAVPATSPTVYCRMTEMLMGADRIIDLSRNQNGCRNRRYGIMAGAGDKKR